MIVVWGQLERELGDKNLNGTSYTQVALDYLLGEDAIAHTVEVILDFEDGWLLADSVL